MASVPVLATVLLVFGACIGSFLNVVACRLPRHESLLHPPSRCLRCGHPLSWHENVPLLGWILLAGRCRHCRAAIPVRYPLVELLTAGLWVSLALAGPAGASPGLPGPLALAGGCVFVSWLVPLVLIDLDHLWLPEPLCRWGTMAGLLFTVLVTLLSADHGAAHLLDHLLAASAGLLGLELVSAVAARLLGQPALGLGDAKLSALLGAWLGMAGLAVSLMLAVVTGAIVGLIGRLSGRLQPRQPFPFGPFLALAGWLSWLMGPRWWLLHGLGGLLPAVG
jgi:leader peptidase (prepilin peptidase)/N-methyltransferase